jgi:uncharacterized protein
MDKEIFLRKVKERIISLDNDAEIMLFGSRARGDFKSTSDWDFLILLQKKATEDFKEKIRNDLFDLELESDEVVSSIIHHKNSWEELNITPLYKIVQKEGVKL